MSMKAEIEQALTAHAAWRSHFWDYLHGRRSLEAECVGDSHHCAFGNWLDHEGHRLISPEKHAEIRAAHDEFHRAAADIVRKIKDRKFGQAKEALSRHGPLNSASARLVESLVNAKLHEPSQALALLHGQELPAPPPGTTPSDAAPESPEANARESGG